MGTLKYNPCYLIWSILLDKELFWLYLTSMWLSIRLIMFEKYPLVLKILWWMPLLSIALIAHFIFPWSEMAVVLLGLLAQKRFYKFMEPMKAYLIYQGDRVEFANDQQDGYVQKFESAKVLRKMRGEDVALSGLFEKELIDLYSHFYLMEQEEKNIIVPYEWILGLEIEELEVDELKG